MATPTSLPATFVAGNVLTAQQMNDLRGAFRVLQCLEIVKLDTFSTSSTSFVDITGLTQSISPSATSSKILLIGSVNISIQDTYDRAVYLKFAGGNSGTYIGDTASNRTRASSGIHHFLYGFKARDTQIQSIVYLDSPNTTSATTYSVQMRVAGAVTGYVNRSGIDTDAADYGRFSSSLTVMEISA
jgi:hypothetical protein